MENSDWEQLGPEEIGGEVGEIAEENRQTLTPKVLDLMQKISEYGYLTMHEVQFIYSNKTWAYKVVKGLRSEGFIADHDTLMSPRAAQYLTTKGYRILGTFGRLKVGFRFKPERYSIFIFRHRMACAKVGLLLEKHPLVHDFLPESRLFKLQKSKFDKLCDGEFWYRVPGHEMPERVGLEVELTLKSKQRLDESFGELGRREDLHQVWWICADDTVRRGMRREVMRRYLPAGQRHFFGLLAEFLAAKGKAELMDERGTLVSIDPAQPTLLPQPPEPPPPPPLPPRPIPTPVNMPVAQAEAPRPPQPVPAPDPQEPLPWRLLSGLVSVALDFLHWSWDWLRESWTVHHDYDGAWSLEFHRWLHVFVVAGIVAVLVAQENLPALVKYIDPPAPPPPRWHSRTEGDLSWSRGEFNLSIPLLESKGRQYRMRVRLEGTEAERWLGCIVDGVDVFDPQDRALARWKISDADAWVHGRRVWTSGFLSFNAPATARELTVMLELDGQLFSGCRRWSVPVGLR